MDANSEARLAEVYPVLADKIHQMETILAQDPLPIKCSCGIRPWAESDKLFQQGRHLENGIWVPDDPVHHTGIVTNAPGGHSYHNLGLAVDCEPVEPDGTIDWNADHPHWKRMEAVGVSLGLTSGANWVRLVDAPHFQLTGRFPENAPTDELRQIFKDGGMSAVWDEVTNSLS